MNEDEHSPYFVNEPTPTTAEWLFAVIGVAVLFLISSSIYFWS